MTPTETRQAIGCGYEKPDPHAGPWSHAGFTGDRPTTCPGYTTKLPEVIEIARIRMHAKNGMARDYLKGDATELVLAGIEYLEAADGEASCWRPEEKK